MIKCEPFIGKPGSNTAGSQPFQMIIQSNVLLSMDFHAHLMTTEIIGFLAGDWDKETMRKLYTKQSRANSFAQVSLYVRPIHVDPLKQVETMSMLKWTQQAPSKHDR